MSRVRTLATLTLVVLALEASAAAAQDRVFFVVRHAERADNGQPVAGATMMEADPDLSPAGHARAKSLAAMLAEAGIRQIFTTEYRRTRQTAAPIAERLQIEPLMTAARETATLVERLRAVSGPVLVVGHSNTIPDIIRALGVSTPVRLQDQDYGDLFIIVARGTAAAPTLIRLKY
jgi:broad specificity phosphatase PhoE